MFEVEGHVGYPDDPAVLQYMNDSTKLTGRLLDDMVSSSFTDMRENQVF